MDYQKIISLLKNTPNQAPKFKTKNWVEVNDELRGTYNVNSQIKFKTSMLRSSLCNYSDSYILVSALYFGYRTNFEVLHINSANSYISVNTSRHIQVRPIQLYVFGKPIKFLKRLRKIFLQKNKFVDISNFQTNEFCKNRKKKEKKDFQSMYVSENSSK